ncbi:hypothetical protein DYB32_010409 [Aphanomyces invadans]|uniref:Uncharacterized protein n=1 Tax=Aphanomyces invadans TaxID=157072 RepID=A0A418AG87_9STRA|nr:hypothetical protein DYB32_010409 [Aphanomyces invadans]
MWMRTGDHIGTAVNVAYALARLQKVISSQHRCQKFALVADGSTMHILLQHETLKVPFEHAVEVVCRVLVCRASPLQKPSSSDCSRYDDHI